MKKFEIFQMKAEKLNHIKGGDIGGPRTYTNASTGVTKQSHRDKDSQRDDQPAVDPKINQG